jgi:putative ABC transport system permease protein
MAIGARRQDIRRMFLREGMIIALAGIVAGALASVFAARALASLLFGVSALDPWTFATVPLLLIALVLFASYLPASRATRVDPIQSLARTE